MTVKKSDIYASIGTIVVCAIVLLILLFCGMSASRDQAAEGIEVSFGYEDDGFGATDQLVADEAQPAEPAAASQPAKPNTAPNLDENLMTQQDESVALAQEKKRKQEQERLLAEQRERERKAAEEARPNASAKPPKKPNAMPKIVPKPKKARQFGQCVRQRERQRQRRNYRRLDAGKSRRRRHGGRQWLVVERAHAEERTAQAAIPRQRSGAYRGENSRR